METVFKVRFSLNVAILRPVNPDNKEMNEGVMLRLAFIAHELNAGTFDGEKFLAKASKQEFKKFLTSQFAKGVFEFEDE